MKIGRIIPDSWIEIIDTISKNKARTILTGLSIAWGIFIFIVLLGAGNSLKNGIQKAYEGDAVNTIKIYGGKTSKKYKGFSPGRDIKLKDKDAYILEEYFNNVNRTAVTVWSNKNVRVDNEVGDFNVWATNVNTQKMENIKLVKGRLLNEIDIIQKRKVAVLGKTVHKQLFKDKSKDIFGKTIFIDDIPFSYVGVFKDKDPWENERVYIPVTTAQMLFGHGDEVDYVVLSTDASVNETKTMVNKLQSLFSRLYIFDKEDQRAIRIDNTVAEYGQTMGVLLGIKYFVALIGILTLISGITGISNIMFIVVKERTNEIGIRKALGAKPRSIIKMIIMEAIFITTIAGYFGLILGIGLLELLNYLLEKAKGAEDGGPLDLFVDPKVNIGMAIFATVLLILSGVAAGYFPARKASKIKPIEALRY